MGWHAAVTDFFIGESVAKVGSDGGGKEMLTLSPNTIRGGELEGCCDCFDGECPRSAGKAPVWLAGREAKVLQFNGNAGMVSNGEESEC